MNQNLAQQANLKVSIAASRDVFGFSQDADGCRPLFIIVIEQGGLYAAPALLPRLGRLAGADAAAASAALPAWLADLGGNKRVSRSA